MRYVMKQKLFSFGDDFVIKDETGQDRYLVDGKTFAVGEKASFRDMEGNELARIEQKVLSISKTFRIFRAGTHVATVKKKPFAIFRDAFAIEDAAAGDLDATGDFIDHEYEFSREGRRVATVSKRFFSFSDTYGVDVAPGEDDILILACTAVIDMCSHNEE